MSSVGRRVCLAIGVADARPLAWLPGAAQAASDIGQWARCSLFDSVTVLTDDKIIGHTRWSKGEEKPQAIRDPDDLKVTIPRIRDELKALLPRGELTEWLVLHFAGHGVRTEGTRTLWLPSDWHEESRAIAVEILKTSLEFYGIENITIIADACRDYVDGQTSNLSVDGVLPRGDAGSARPALERINAAPDGKLAYMVPGAKPKDARCILSSVFADAVWGHEPGAFAKHEPDRVLSGSLFRHVIRTTKDVGQRYGLNSQADVDVNLGSGSAERVYFDRVQPPSPLAPPTNWPPARSSIRAEPIAPSPHVKGFSRLSPVGPTLSRRDPDEIDFAGEGDGGGSDITGSADDDHGLFEPDGSEGRLISLVVDNLPGSAPRRLSRQSRIKASLRNSQRRRDPEGQLVVRGGSPVHVWSPVYVERLGRRKAWKLDAPLVEALQIVVEFHDGLFAPVVIYPHLTTYCVRRKNKIAGWYCVSHYEDGPAALTQTFDAIARLQTSKLSSSDADKLAAGIRRGKHTNPVLGTIAAYLYDYIGDRDNIRRIACYYSHAGQPVPFDIVQLGLLEYDRSVDGLTHLIVPPVPEADVKDQSRPWFTTAATSKALGMVGGRCPWLRQGWDTLSVPDLHLGPDTDILRRLVPHLTDSSFTALERVGGLMMVEAFNLRRDR